MRGILNPFTSTNILFNEILKLYLKKVPTSTMERIIVEQEQLCGKTTFFKYLHLVKLNPTAKIQDGNKKTMQLTMRNTEAEIETKYRTKGYETLRRGWPDFVFIKRNKDGKLTEALFREVKYKEDGLRKDQLKMFNLLKDLELNIEVEWVST